jgi:hypothetical protein
MHAALHPPENLGTSRTRRALMGCRPASAARRATPSARAGDGEPCRRAHRDLRSPMHDALQHHLQLGPVRDRDWVTAHFGHR